MIQADVNHSAIALVKRCTTRVLSLPRPCPGTVCWAYARSSMVANCSEPRGAHISYSLCHCPQNHYVSALQYTHVHPNLLQLRLASLLCLHLRTCCLQALKAAVRSLMASESTAATSQARFPVQATVPKDSSATPTAQTQVVNPAST